jgi:hypothetical protein
VQYLQSLQAEKNVEVVRNHKNETRRLVWQPNAKAAAFGQQWEWTPARASKEGRMQGTL